MINRISGLKKLFFTAFIPGITPTKRDNVELTSKTAIEMVEELQEIKSKETGFDRLYHLFSVDEFGRPTPELVNIWHVMMLSAATGAAMGGFVRSRVSFLDFVEKNDATSFKSHLDAKQKLQHKVTTGFAKGAWQWGWRLTAFTGCYTLTSTLISMYRDKNGILEHIIAGMVTGATYKFSLGVRGVVVGGSLGAVLGTVSGISIWGIMKMTGVTMTDLRNKSYAFKTNRDEAFQERINEYIAKKEPEYVRERDAKVGKVNITLDNIDVPPQTEVKTPQQSPQ